MTVIRLIGVPAPSDGGSQAPTSPFTTRQGPTFHPDASPSNQVFPGKETIIVTQSRPGLVSDAPRARSPRPLFQQKSVLSAKWMEFPRYARRRTATVHRLTATPKHEPVRNAVQSSCPNQSHAEHEPHQDPTPWAIGGCGLNVSAEASTRTPQLHQPHLLWEPSSSPNMPSPTCHSGPERLSIFGRGFRLRCFQPLSPIAWLPGSALSNNR